MTLGDYKFLPCRVQRGVTALPSACSSCCAQQTGVHRRDVEALLIVLLPGGEQMLKH
jgi:hypothetical protein